MTHHPDPAAPLDPEESIIHRLRTPKAFHAEVKQRLHPGMTLIVSDLATHPDRRSGTDFVIMDSGRVESPMPTARPSNG